MDLVKQIFGGVKFGPIRYDGTLDDEAFNSLPALVILQIFKEIPEEETMKLRSVSKLWNNYILASRIVKLKANDDNWDLLTKIAARYINLHIHELSSVFTFKDKLTVSFCLPIGIRKLDVDQISPTQLYDILSCTKNLESLNLNNFLRKPFIEDLAWAASFDINEEFTKEQQAEWLKKLRYLKINSSNAKFQAKEFIRELLKPCHIRSVSFEDKTLMENSIFHGTCFNYENNPDDPRKFIKLSLRVIRDFLADHKTTIKEIEFNKMDGEMKMKIDYDLQSERIQIQEISLSSIAPVRKLDQAETFLGILDVIRAQTSIKTLEIGKFNGRHIDAFGYRDLLVQTILPNNATTLRKLEIYMDSDNPQTKRMSWQGSMFSSLLSLQSLCLRSKQSVPFQVFDRINLLPSSLTVLKTSYCISFPFGIGPVEGNTLEDIWPNLEKLHIESIPWFVFNDGETVVTQVDKNLVLFLSNFKNLKEWELTVQDQ